MSQKPSLTKTTWQEIREEAHKVNSEFANIVDDIDPGDDMPLYIAEYPYGTIIDDGIFYYPDENGELKPRADESLAKSVRKDFEYVGESIPIGLVLDKVVELFTHTGEYFSPWSHYFAGDIFALSVHLPSNSYHPLHILQMCAGTRSIHMLPNIGDAFYHEKIQRKFSTAIPAPKLLESHWGVFKEIYSQSSLAKSWSTRTLLLTSSWASKVKSDPSWARLKLYFYEFSWRKTAFERNRRFYDLAISIAQTRRNLKPNPYLLDTAKHIFKIIAGGAPGYAVAVNDDMAPTSLISDVYSKIYPLKGYHPHIFVPEYFKVSSDVVYYSLNAPTALEYSPSSRREASTLHKLRDLKHILNILIDEVITTQTELEGTKMLELLKSTEIVCLHNKADVLGEVSSSQSLPDIDRRIVDSLSQSGLKLSHSGAFLRGCIALLER